MVDYAPPWDSLPRDTMHSAHEMPLSQVRKSAAALAALLDENKDEQVLKEACLGLCQLFGEGIQNDRIQAILEANVVPKLVALLRPSKSRSVPIPVQSAALQVLGNVACGDDRQTQVVIDSNALPCLRALLSSADRSIRKEVCWIVSNITESSHQVQDVLDADILPPLLKLLDNQDAACREDATWVLFNLSSNRDPNQIAYLAEKNGVRALCNLLTCSKELDVLWKGCGTVAAVALKGLRNILISGQIAAASDPSGYNKMASLVAEAHGVERIEALTTHASLDVRTRARLLLERMFGAEATTADLAPPLPPPALTGLSSLLSPSPPMPLAHGGCSCSYQQHHHSHASVYPAPYDGIGTANMHGTLSPSPHVNHGIGVEHSLSGHLHPDSDLVDVPGSTSGSSTDSDPEDDDSDSDLIPPPPEPCSCVLCMDPTPLAEKRPRGKGSVDEPEMHKRSIPDDVRFAGEIRQICDFCSGGGRLGDGRAGLAAKLGRAVRLGHPHCIAVLLSRMTWSQRVAATEAPALLHPGGGPPDGGVGSSLPAVVLAAQLGKPGCLGLLLRRCQPDLDVTHGKRRLTALAWAAHKGYSRCCQLLIEHGANPATRCGDGVTALHLAASGGGHITICKLLIEHNAPVNARSAKKQTPLCLAAQKGFVKVVQLLLEHGADPNNEDEGKYTPLHLSASNGFVSCVDLLLKAGARVDATTRNGVTPLHYAVQGGYAQAVKLLISAGAKVNCNRKPLLLIAADDGNLEVVQILLDAQAAIDCKANIKAQLDKDMEFFDFLTPLHLASSRGHHDVVELLLRRGAFVDEITTKSGWSALDFAVLNGRSECAIALLKHGASVTENCRSVGRNNWTLVQYAAHHGAKDVVRMLIQRLKEQRVNATNLSRNPTEGNINLQLTNGDTPFPDGTAMGPIFPPEESFDPIAPADYGNSDAVQEIRTSAGSNGDQQLCQHEEEGVLSEQVTPQRYDPRSTDGDDAEFASSTRQNSTPSGTESTQKSGVTRRRVVKEDRQSALRARELKKREAEALEARERLQEAMASRSIPKLTESIAHVSKLVLHFATTPTGDNGGNGNHSDHSDMNGYGSHADSYGHSGHVHGTNGGHPGHNGAAASSVAGPMAIEIGLGNEVQRARKILAGLLAEEKRAREEKEREVAITKRENTQQAVRKAITAALDGGDPRSLSRATNRATRTILEKDDPVVQEATKIASLIADLEKWEGLMSAAIRNKNLDSLAEALPNVSNALLELKTNGGEGASVRIFNGSNPSAALESAKQLREELVVKRESEKAKEAEAQNLERAAQDRLKSAVDSDDIVELESALNQANAAVRSKESELSSTIESAKKVMAKWLKMERRKLRQACNSNDPAVIEKAVEAAEAFGLNALKGDIESTRGLAKKLREQAEALEILEDAITKADVGILNDVRNKLTSLGMFPEAEKARVELDKLQKATRARSLLETALEEAKKCQDPFLEALSKVSSDNGEVELQVSWTWPDAQRLCDLSDRARKWGQPLSALCDSADTLAKELAELGRRVLTLATKSDDARAIAAVINGYKESFVNVSKPELFDKTAGEEAIRRAQERLAMVQAEDQASIKAESAQVKVEYALATSRRAATRNRSGKNAPTTKSQGQQQNGSVYGSSASPVGNGHMAADGTDQSPSSFSSDYGEDDGSEADMGIAGVLQGDSGLPARGIEVQKVVRRARGVSQFEDSIPLDALGDLPATSGGCSHFYLFKEGTTVCCARCGHLRNSGNPEWLARVKRRGNKQPPEGALGSLPSIGSAPDLQSSFPGVSTNGSGQSLSPPAMSTLDRTSQRSGRMPIGAPHHYVSQGFPVTPVNSRDTSRAMPALSTRSNPNTPSVNMMVQLMQHQQLPQPHFAPQGHHHSPQQQARLNQGAHSQTPQNLHGKSGNHQRGRGRPHVTHMAARVDPRAPGLSGMYSTGLAGGRGLGSMDLATSMPIQTSFPATTGIQGLPPGMAGTPTAQVHAYAVRGTGALTTIDPKSGLRIPNDVGSVVQGVQGLQLGHGNNHAGGRETGTNRGPSRGAQDEMGLSGMDLGEDFANENFGFDIDAIVDDNPPPGPSKPLSAHDLSAHSNMGKMYVPSSHTQQNGYYRR